jgi:hypothetical protein
MPLVAWAAHEHGGADAESAVPEELGVEAMSMYKKVALVEMS